MSHEQRRAVHHAFVRDEVQVLLPHCGHASSSSSLSAEATTIQTGKLMLQSLGSKQGCAEADVRLDRLMLSPCTPIPCLFSCSCQVVVATIAFGMGIGKWLMRVSALLATQRQEVVVSYFFGLKRVPTCLRHQMCKSISTPEKLSCTCDAMMPPTTRNDYGPP